MSRSERDNVIEIYVSDTAIREVHRIEPEPIERTPREPSWAEVVILTVFTFALLRGIFWFIFR